MLEGALQVGIVRTPPLTLHGIASAQVIGGRRWKWCRWKWQEEETWEAQEANRCRQGIL